jgi:hypothetical protein
MSNEPGRTDHPAVVYRAMTKLISRIRPRIAGLAVKSQDGAVGLITRRSRVRIPPPLLDTTPAKAGVVSFLGDGPRDGVGA